MKHTNKANLQLSVLEQIRKANIQNSDELAAVLSNFILSIDDLVIGSIERMKQSGIREEIILILIIGGLESELRKVMAYARNEAGDGE